MIELIYNIIYFLMGLLTPSISQFVTTLITKKDTHKQQTPKEMLGRFYKGQALKLATFTICCLCAMLFAKEKSNIVMFGVISGVIIQKTIETRRKLHESHVTYTN